MPYITVGIITQWRVGWGYILYKIYFVMKDSVCNFKLCKPLNVFVSLIPVLIM